MKKTSVILGVTGQDGSYLAELLLAQGYVVHGILRRTSQLRRERIDHLRIGYPRSFFLHYGDLTDVTSLRRLLIQIEPDEIYHLAGQSHVGLSFEIPESTFQEVAGSTLSLLEICRDLEKSPRVLLIGSSEVFGEPDECPQTETTRHRPLSPYGCAKSATLHLGEVYRRSFDLFVSYAIPYNHESIRRGANFVTRKITSCAAKIAKGAPEVLKLGNLNGERDWGYAPEYVEAMHLILSHETPDSFILATGTTTSVREFARSAFEALDIELVFEGEGVDERGLEKTTGKELIRVEPKYFRPSDPCRLVGDASKVLKLLSWKADCAGVSVARQMASEEYDLLEG